MSTGILGWGVYVDALAQAAQAEADAQMQEEMDQPREIEEQQRQIDILTQQQDELIASVPPEPFLGWDALSEILPELDVEDLNKITALIAMDDEGRYNEELMKGHNYIMGDHPDETKH